MDTILVIDMCTFSMRGILYDRCGEVVFRSKCGCVPKAQGTCVEQEPQSWLDALEQCAMAAADREAALSPARAKGLTLLPHFTGGGSNDWNHSAEPSFLA